MNPSTKRFLKYLANLRLAEATDSLDRFDVQADLSASLSPLRHGQIAARASQRLENRLTRRLIAKSLVQELPPRLPQYDPQMAIAVAKLAGTEEVLWRLLDGWTGHALFPGTTGSGKTSALAGLVDAFVAHGVSCLILARKEAGRLMLRYPQSILLRPQELPINFAAPIGDARLFFAELIPILARGIGVRSDSIPKFLEVTLRAHLGEVAKGRLLSFAKLERIFGLLGQRGDRRCETIASSLATFALFLGDTARIEGSPAWEHQFPVIIIDREAAPPAYRACLDGLLQHRFQVQAAQEGYTSHLRRVILYDEAGLEFGREFESQQAGGGFISAAKRGISQMRSYGVAILYFCQSYGLIAQDIKDNTNWLFAFRVLSAEDIRELGDRMNLTGSQKMRLPTFPPGRALVSAPDLTGAVEVQFPFVELGSYPSEDQIQARMESVLHNLRQKLTMTRETPLTPLDVDEILGEEATSAPEPLGTPTNQLQTDLLAEHRSFLCDVVQHADSGIAARFRRLGFGGSKGNRIKEELIALGLLETVEVRKSPVGAPTKVLRLTERARSLPGLWQEQPD